MKAIRLLFLYSLVLMLLIGSPAWVSAKRDQSAVLQGNISQDYRLFLPLVDNGFPAAPNNMIYVPAGEFQMGCHPDHNRGYQCLHFELPLHSVWLDAYYIDKMEVTNSQYAECVERGYCEQLSSYSSATRSYYYGNPYYENYPVIYVTFEQAWEYCAWAMKRMPTEAEWEKAANGATIRTYPWGDTKANCALANFREWDYCVGDTTEVGSYPAGASPYGVLDMAGNVSEWVGDWYSPTFYSESPYINPYGPETGEDHQARGGSWLHAPSPLRTAARGYLWPDSNSNIGFRCVKSAP